MPTSTPSINCSSTAGESYTPRDRPGHSALLLPGQPGFDEILQTTPPPGWREAASGDFGGGVRFVVGMDGLMRQAVTEDEFDDYFYGGEYDVRLAQIETDPEDDLWDEIDHYGAIFETAPAD